MKVPRPLPSRDEIRRFIRELPGRVASGRSRAPSPSAPSQKAELRELLRALKEEEGATDPPAPAACAPAAACPKRRSCKSPAPTRTATPSPGPAVAGRRAAAADPDGARAARPPGARAGRARARAAQADRPGPLRGPHRQAPRPKRPAACSASIRPGQPAGRIVPTDRRAKAEWIVPAGRGGGAEPGEIVLAEPLPHHGYGLKPARVIERLGAMGDARSVSLICHPHPRHPAGVPARRAGRKPTAPARSRSAGAPICASRRSSPSTARTRATSTTRCYAEPDGDGLPPDRRDRRRRPLRPPRLRPRPRGASRAATASISPTASCRCCPRRCRTAGAACARTRSAAACSPRCGSTPEGRKTAHRFGRGLMRSAARLTYEQVQQRPRRGRSARPAGLPHALRRVPRPARRPDRARHARSRPAGAPGRARRRRPGRRSVAPRPRLDSHRLIEEFMVLANVAAAEELERLPPALHVPGPRPAFRGEARGAARLPARARHRLPPGNSSSARPRPRAAPRRRHAEAPLVNEVMLRSQSQAAYSPDNIGHFGLALPRYAHFTSPIRRYADLLVHRALIRGLRLGEGALAEDEAGRFAEPPSTSPRPSAARRWPSGTRSTVTSPPTWRTKWARFSRRAFPG